MANLYFSPPLTLLAQRLAPKTLYYRNEAVNAPLHYPDDQLTAPSRTAAKPSTSHRDDFLIMTNLTRSIYTLFGHLTPSLLHDMLARMSDDRLIDSL